MRRQITITVGELRYISINCPHCRTVMTLDMLEPSEIATKHKCFGPLRCSVCEKDYDSAIRPNVDALWKAYQSLRQIEDRISFTLDLPGENINEKLP
ncbi:MAG: hypothetical protein ABSH44_03725 [Bryobacteraceae bacterium]|jgi:phage FluMu protein Com